MTRFKRLFLIGLCITALSMEHVAAQPGIEDEVEQVALIIVDVFEKSTDDPDAQLLNTQTNGQNCLLTPYGQGHIAISGATGRPSSELHGQVVYNQMFSLIERSGFGAQIGAALAVTSVPVSRADSWQSASGQYLHLMGVDTDGYTSEVIAERIRTVIEEIQSLDISMIVGLLPWGIASCEDLPQRDNEAVESYMDEVGEQFPELKALFNQIVSETDDPWGALHSSPEFALLAEPTAAEIDEEDYRERFLTDTDDRLFVDLQTLADRNGVTFIASAGNLGWDFAMAPGAWGSVVSVSADYEDYGPRGCQEGNFVPMSNAGEIMNDGVYNCLTGTSFAAPRAALDYAFFALNGGQPDCGTMIPALSQAIYQFGNRPISIAALDAGCDLFREQRYLPEGLTAFDLVEAWQTNAASDVWTLKLYPGMPYTNTLNESVTASNIVDVIRNNPHRFRYLVKAEATSIDTLNLEFSVGAHKLLHLLALTKIPDVKHP